MARRLRLTPHHATEELSRLSRQAHDRVARSHWQILWLVSQGRPTADVAATVGYSIPWVRTVARHYNTAGAAGVGDGRHANPGKAPLLTLEQQAALDCALDAPHPDGEEWNSRTMADWITAETGHGVGKQRGWEYLSRLGRTSQRP
jgi:transposase